jgi:16S rRNA (guanine527-N7)-methyltransferase
MENVWKPAGTFDAKAFSKRLMEAIIDLFTSPPLPRDRAELLVAFGVRLAEASRSINLTRILDPNDMAVRHFLDAYHLLTVLKGTRGPVLDVGCGGGVPGIPLAIFRKNLHLVLIDGTAKKIRYVAQWLEELRLKNAKALHARVEEHLKIHSYAAAITRAAVKPARLLEILSTTGPVVDRLIFMEGAKGEETARTVIPLAARVGYRFDLALPYRLPGMNRDRYLVCFKKSVHPLCRR